MPPDQWVPGNPDLALLIEIGLVILSGAFIWRIAIIKEQTPRSILALALFAVGVIAGIWAAALNIVER
ncbi:MAG TPA: hypothetical protein VF601_12270 [Beijerinckiaceae bacterium]|jgi:hypothetical protein